MNTYLFRTTATMKPYNNKKWWIDSGIIRDKRIQADNLPEALAQYRQEVENNDYVTISPSALRNKQPMYVDTAAGPVQVGYVITASTEFDNDHRGWVKQYIELWVSVEIVTPVFEGV